MAGEMIHFKNQLDQLLINETSKSKKIRLEAFDKFSSIGFPTKKWEEWKFTDFSSIKKSTFTLSGSTNKASNFKSFTKKIQDSFCIFFINGNYSSALSNIPKNITINTKLDFLNSDLTSAENSNPFLSLNTSMANSGIQINIEDKLILEKPIQLIYLTNQSLMGHPRIILKLGRDSKATFIEHYLGLTDESYYINPVTQISLNDNATLSHIRIQEENIKANHTAYTDYALSKDSLLDVTSISSGSSLFRQNIKLKFNGVGAYANLNGLTLAKEKQHHDQHITVDHSNSSCQSRQLFKYILADDSSGVFNGKVIVHKNTAQTNADQSNKNLLLSASALMNANPQLEIYAEDVKCSHGSTTGQIDPEALFYLRSRGLNKQRAMELIVEGFARDVLSPIKNEDVKSYLSDHIANWLGESLKND